MNILPKKRWHVRTRENIARVRKDEAQAAEEAKEQERRVLLAEQEFRTAALRQKARKRYSDGSNTDAPSEKKPSVEVDESRHVNLFEDLEAGNVSSTQVNAEHEKEEKEEREKYEKQIGYLTYLGQDSKQESWYDKPPKRGDCKSLPSKSKLMADPINDMNKYLRHKEKAGSTKKVEHTRGSTSKPSKSTSVDIAKLRAERLKREQEEKLRAEKLLAKLRGDPVQEEEEEQEKSKQYGKQRYNSQFNPHLAKQNYKPDDHTTKYRRR